MGLDKAAARKVVRVAIGCPSYKGPHKDTFDSYHELMHYFGRLQERSYLPPEHRRGLPPLDRMEALPLAELRDDEPVFEFVMVTRTGNSLIGQARDSIVEAALATKCDYLFFYDDDMIFGRDAFLRLWRHQKPFVGALAFTAREPIAPVLYKFHRTWNFDRQRDDCEIQVIFDYPKDTLFQVDGIGAGVVLIDMACFRAVPQPWFHGAVSAGEDIHFCWSLYRNSIPVYCDTSVKTLHVPNVPVRWHDEAYFLESRDKSEAWYRSQRGAA